MHIHIPTLFVTASVFESLKIVGVHGEFTQNMSNESLWEIRGEHRLSASHKLTPGSRVLLEELICNRLLQMLSEIYKPRRFTIVFNTACFLSLSGVKSIPRRAMVAATHIT